MKTGVAENLQRFQSEMVDKFLSFQRESEVRFLAWEQERWRLEQTMLERWRAEQRNHDKEMSKKCIFSTGPKMVNLWKIICLAKTFSSQPFP